jgi:Sulfotransferase family
MTGQTFIYCVGAAKAGTSWLFDVLFHHAECHFPAVKEMHYWDVLENGTGGFFREQSRKRLDWLQMRRAQVDDPEVNAYQERSMADIRGWLEAFDGKTRNDAAYLDFLGRGRAGAKVIGDFTPSYALLEKPSFAAMAGVMEKVKFIFLMRDPVARAWSHIRMDNGDKGEVAALAKFDAFLNGGEQNIARRNNYRRTLNKLLDVIPRENLFVEFYERLFTSEAVARLTGFLGIAPVTPDFGKQINRSAAISLDPARQAAARDVLAPQYNFVSKFMGELPAEWTDRQVVA